MVEGEKLSLIAERELMVYDSGREEGYVDGFIEGSDEALDRVIEILDNMTGGHTIALVGVANGRGFAISTTLPTDENDYEYQDYTIPEDEISDVKELYVWATCAVAYISVSFNDETIYMTNDVSFEYAKAHPIPITADGTYTITTDW